MTEAAVLAMVEKYASEQSEEERMRRVCRELAEAEQGNKR